MERLKNQAVFLTGVTGGIGGAIAHLFSQAGARLALSGRDEAKLKALADQLECETCVVPADVTDESQVATAMESARKELGQLDTLINVPGLSVPAKLAEMDLSDFQRIFDVNVTGMFLCSKHFIQQLDADRGGLIISISSVAARNANPNAPAYCAAKVAMNMLSDGLTMQYKQNNVKVSVVSPGAVSTEGFWGDRPVPHDKFLKPEEVAEVVGFVAALPESVIMQDVVFQPWEFFKTK
jgi:NADP-dependent 3-hydroxy acid dehydrogenase YdfG